MGSAKFKLNWGDLVGVAKNAALIGGAAALTVLAARFGLISFLLVSAYSFEIK